MEALRLEDYRGKRREIVLALSKWRQMTLGDIYAAQLGTPVIWGGGISGLLQQALLLQPRCLVTISREDTRLKRHPYRWPDGMLRLSESMIEERAQTLAKLKLAPSKYIALAIFSIEYDLERHPKHSDKQFVLQTVGSELVEAIDFLQEQRIGVVMLGSAEDETSRIPRSFPRLSEFGELGGPHEVHLASCCKYFWTDNTGAWWLAAPFKRPVLITNNATQRPRRGKMQDNHLIVPLRYREWSGRDLTLREIYSKSNAFYYKAASRGELQIVRNTAAEIVDAQREMLARVDGNWIESDKQLELQDRLREVQADFPEIHPMNVSSLWLSRHPHLLD